MVLHADMLKSNTYTHVSVFTGYSCRLQDQSREYVEIEDKVTSISGKIESHEKNWDISEDRWKQKKYMEEIILEYRMVDRDTRDSVT